MLLKSLCIDFFCFDRQTPPAPRFDHTAAVHANRYLLIFGGCSHSIFFNDLHVLDLETVSDFFYMYVYIFCYHLNFKFMIKKNHCIAVRMVPTRNSR